MDALSPLFLVVLLGGFYLLAIRPQKARLRAIQQTQSSLAPGQVVMTTAGLYGTVTGLDDDDVHLEVSPGVVLRFARGAVAKQVPVVGADGDASAAPPTVTPG